jgi:hypothetical protein
MFGSVAAGFGVISGYGHLAVGLIHRIQVLSGSLAITRITMDIVLMFEAIGDIEFSPNHFAIIAI